MGAQAVVSFDVPLNLTQLHGDIVRVRAICGVTSEAIVPAPLANSGAAGGDWSNLTSSSTSSYYGENLPPNAGRQEMAVFNNQAVATVRVIVAIPAEWLVNPIGKKAVYSCGVMGYSRTAQKWGFFSDQSTELAFKLKVVPEGFVGEFVW
jgi:hypothetical protein